MIGFVKGYQVEHRKLAGEGRKQIKVFRIDAEKDIDVKALKKITALLKKCY